MSSEMFSYKLSEIGIIITGTTPPTNKSYYWGGEIPFYSPADINGNVYCVDTERSISLKGLSFGRKIPENSILVTCIGSIGKIAINAVEGLTNQQINTLIPSPQFDFQYVYYLILSNINKLINIAPQTTIPILNKREFGKLTYIFHPLKEQQKIASILLTIDQVIEKTEALIEKYQQIKAGLMHDLFTRGITADGKLRPPREQAPELYQETPIGWIPKDWGVKQIGKLFHIQLGKMLSKVAKTGKGSAFYLGNKNVQWDKVNIENLESMDFSPSERKKFNLVYGDLLVCEGGDVGRTALWHGELNNCFYQKAVHRLRPLNNEVVPKLMLRYMKHAKFAAIFNNYTSQTSIAHLTQEKLSSINMFVPPEDEQQRMIKQFNLIDQKTDKEIELFNKLKKQKQGLMQDLLTGKVPVKVDNPEVSHEK